ncbi:MAG TPA: DUF1552 domain-containing protein [Polyangiales bacterium]|nr:DUF1552 domain-containing protein [Polyangiales bacterium]
MSGRITRRDLLKSAAGGVLLAPFLRRRRLEAQQALPKRLVLVFTPDSHPREWWPLTQPEPPGFSLREPLLDFAGLEKQLLFVRRVDHSWSLDNHHEAGVAQLFTGQRFFDAATHYANGPSIDQVLLANTPLRGGTPVSDIHLCAADRGGGDKRHVCCYSGPDQPIQRRADPARAYAQIFHGFNFGSSAAGSAPTPADEARRRALQVNTAELRRMQAFLGSEERARLELHVQALRDLELQIAASAGPSRGPACQPLSTERLEMNDHDEQVVRRWAKLQVDLIVNAFACDRTRVAELGFGFSGSHHTGMLGLVRGTNSWHDIAHSLDDTARLTPVTLAGQNVNAATAFVQFDRFWASHVAYLARSLAQIEEPGGTMLDNTLIYWGAESGTDHNHTPHDMQYLLIGGRNLGIATGQFLQPAAVQSAHKLHTSVLHAFGFTQASGFGIEPECGPLAGVLR